MKEYFNKITKLLCYLFITIFAIGFGGEVVKAETVTYDSSVDVWFNKYINTRIKTMNGEYVFCLNPGKWINTGNNAYSLTDKYNGQSDLIRSILANAYQRGLGKDNNSYGLSKNDMYYVTQLAIWNRVSSADPGSKWLAESAGRQQFFSDLLNTPYSQNAYYLFIPNQLAGEFDEVDSYYVSKKSYKINNELSNLPEGVSYNISIGNGSTNGACILYNGECKTEFTGLSKDSEFKIKMPIPLEEVNDDLKVSVNITSSQYISGYEVKTYTAGNNSQDVTRIVPTYGSLSTSFGTGLYHSGLKEVSIEKTDGSKRVGGAYLQVLDSNNNVVFTAKSVSTGDNPKVSLPVGDYKLVEVKAPKNYKLNKTPVSFSVVDDGGVLKIKQNNSFVDSATISVTDRLYRTRFRKLDSEGKPVAGMRIEIIDYTSKEVMKSKMSDYLYVCAISDENGYLTKPCTDLENYENYYSADGIYTLDTGLIYYINEDFSNTHYYTAEFTDNVWDFVYNGDSLTYVSSDIAWNYTDELYDNYTSEIFIYNKLYIDISKTDATGGAEIPGATLTIYDAEETFKSDDGSENLMIVDTWVSDTTPHKFIGIVPNHKYILEEEVAPKGYAKISTQIMFSMDEEGNVTAYDPNTGEAISNVAASKYAMLVKNDAIIEDVPKTGTSMLNLFAFGGLMIFIGYETIKIYRRKALTK